MRILLKSILIVTVFHLISCNNNKPDNSLNTYKNVDTVADFAPELWLVGNTFKGSFSEDYNTFYFFRKVAPEVEKYIPYRSEFENGQWNTPEIMEHYNDENSYTYQVKIPNKNKLIITSNKKTKNDTSQNPNYNFWEVDLINNKPEELAYNDLIYNYNSQPCITNNGTIYFTSDLPDWSKTLAYKMPIVNQKYQEPQRFNPVNEWRKNKNWTVYEFCMAPNEDYMIVCISSKENEALSVDLYISYNKDNQWTYPKKLSDKINTKETENFPVITQDGNYLIFTRAFSAFKIVSTKLLESK